MAIAAVGIRGNMFLRQKFDPNWFLAENTHLYKYNMERADYFPDIGQNAGIYIGRLNYSTELPNIHRLVKQFTQEKEILKEFEEWYSSLRYYMNKTLHKG